MRTRTSYDAPQTSSPPFSRLLAALEASMEKERAELIRRLRIEVQQGRYRPNLEVVAERLWLDLGPAVDDEVESAHPAP
jgi:hypothetical protein